MQAKGLSSASGAALFIVGLFFLAATYAGVGIFAGSPLSKELAGEAYGVFVLGGTVFGAIYLATHTPILRDRSLTAATETPRPYSFSRTQIFFWTVVVLVCFALTYWFGGFWKLNSTCLVLLGIGGLTSVGATIIEQRRDIATTDAPQDAISEGFLLDILSDSQGVNVNRFQAVFFNVAYMLVFVQRTFDTRNVLEHQFATFETFEFALLGMSSAFYLGGKTFEPTPKNEQANTPTDDEQVFDRDSVVAEG